MTIAHLTGNNNDPVRRSCYIQCDILHSVYIRASSIVGRVNSLAGLPCFSALHIVSLACSISIHNTCITVYFNVDNNNI